MNARAIAAAALLLTAACTEDRSQTRAVAVLVDVSGTYFDRVPEQMRVVRAGLLPAMRPGDAFLLYRIAERSYADDALVERATFDVQPSRANAQKLGLASALDKFTEGQKKAKFSDVTGAILLASEHLKKVAAGKRSIIIFSDLREELPKGVKRALEKDDLAGVDVYVMVKRLAPDENDRAAFRARIKDWEKKVKDAGAASFTEVDDPQALARTFGDDE